MGKQRAGVATDRMKPVPWGPEEAGDCVWMKHLAQQRENQRTLNFQSEKVKTGSAGTAIDNRSVLVNMTLK